MQIALGRELIAMQGPGADEVATCYERAQALQPSIESAAERCAILWGLWVFYLNRGPLETAKEVADRHFDLIGGIRRTDPIAIYERAQIQPP